MTAPAYSTELADTFDDWRQNTNSIDAAAGNLVDLTTTAKGTMVAAVNEIQAFVYTAGTPAPLTGLTTTAKGSLLAAINELDGEIGILTSLTTGVKSSIVLAINDIVTDIGAMSGLASGEATLVAAINEARTSSSITLDNITGGPLAVAKGGTGNTALGTLSSSSGAIVVTSGSNSVVSNVSLAFNASGLLLTSFGGILSVEKGGTGKSDLGNLTASVVSTGSSSAALTVTGGTNTIIATATEVILDTGKITSLGTLTSVTVTGTSTLGAITASGIIESTSATPIKQTNVTTAGITDDAHVPTKAYVDSKTGAYNTEVTFNSDIIPAPRVPDSTNKVYAIAHGTGAEPTFVMSYIQSYGEGADEQVALVPSMDASHEDYPPGFISYDGTNINTRYASSAKMAYTRTLGESANPIDTGNIQLVAVSKTGGYNSGWLPINQTTNTYTTAHGLGVFPRLTTVELAQNADGSGWKIPKMGCSQFKGSATADWRQTSLVKLDNTNVTIQTYASGKLAEFKTTDGTTVQPVTATSCFYRVQCIDWAPDYDSGWATIDNTVSNRNKILSHNLGITPSIAMLYLAQDVATDGDSTLSGTGVNPSGWVVLALGQYSPNGNQGTNILQLNRSMAIIKGGSTYLARFRDITGAIQAITSCVYRLMLWK